MARSNDWVECGSCGEWHRSDFYGDCREDSERFADPPWETANSILTLEEQLEKEEKGE